MGVDVLANRFYQVVDSIPGHDEKAVLIRSRNGQISFEPKVRRSFFPCLGHLFHRREYDLPLNLERLIALLTVAREEVHNRDAIGRFAQSLRNICDHALTRNLDQIGRGNRAAARRNNMQKIARLMASYRKLSDMAPPQYEIPLPGPLPLHIDESQWQTYGPDDVALLGTLGSAIRGDVHAWQSLVKEWDLVARRPVIMQRINAPSKQGFTMAAWAFLDAPAEVALWFLERTHGPDALRALGRPQDGRSLLFRMIHENSRPKIEACLKLLCERFPYVLLEAAMSRDPRGRTPLFLLFRHHSDLVEHVLETGMRCGMFRQVWEILSARGPNGGTLLHKLARRGSLRIWVLIIKACTDEQALHEVPFAFDVPLHLEGQMWQFEERRAFQFHPRLFKAALAQKNHHGVTPFTRLLERGNIDLIQALRASLNDYLCLLAHVKSDDGVTALERGYLRGGRGMLLAFFALYPERAHELLGMRSDQGRGIVHTIAARGDFSLLTELQMPCEVFFPHLRDCDSRDMTPLMYACRAGQFSFIDKIFRMLESGKLCDDILLLMTMQNSAHLSLLDMLHDSHQASATAILEHFFVLLSNNEGALLRHAAGRPDCAPAIASVVSFCTRLGKQHPWVRGLFASNETRRIIAQVFSERAQEARYEALGGIFLQFFA